MKTLLNILTTLLGWLNYTPPRTFLSILNFYFLQTKQIIFLGLLPSAFLFAVKSNLIRQAVACHLPLDQKGKAFFNIEFGEILSFIKYWIYQNIEFGEISSLAKYWVWQTKLLNLSNKIIEFGEHNYWVWRT